MKDSGGAGRAAQEELQRVNGVDNAADTGYAKD
jgi:hypothetical protein